MATTEPHNFGHKLVYLSALLGVYLLVSLFGALVYRWVGMGQWFILTAFILMCFSAVYSLILLQTYNNYLLSVYRLLYTSDEAPDKSEVS